MPRNYSTVRYLRPLTRDWAYRARVAGVELSSSLLLAADAFIKSLESASLVEKIYRLSILSGPSLPAALVPLIARTSSKFDLNFGFVDADYSQATGLKGDGVNKHLRTGVRARTLSVADASLWAWGSGYEGTSTTKYLLGSFETSGPQLELAAVRPGVNPKSAAQITIQSTGREVFFEALRTYGLIGASSSGLSSFNLSWNGDVETKNTATISAPTASANREVFLFGRNTGSAVNTQFPSEALAYFYMIGKAITQAEGRQLWGALATFLTAVGRVNIDSTQVPVVMWGDSFSVPATGVYLYESFTPRRRVFSAGVGGEISTQIKNRFLADPDTHSNTTVIWSGRNNYGSVNTVMADIAEMVQELTGPFVILSVFNGDTEGAGTQAYTDLLALNALFAETYPDNYLDLRSYMVEQYDPGTPSDVQNHADDIPPGTLRQDTLHLNNAGRAVAMARVAEFIKSKGW